MIAFLFPGQGSQKVGMGRALADAFAEARATFDEADAAFADGQVRPGSLSTLCFEGPEDQLMLTEYTQPAILTVSIAAARVLTSRGIQPDLVAGHSLGEYSANVVAGTFGFADAVRVIRRRGRYMQEAVPVGQGAMAAILGLDAASVRRACEDAAQGEVVAPANINSPDQLVIAGSAAAVQRAGERAKALGAKRVVSLPVSAPFHCALMKPAEERLCPGAARAGHAGPAVSRLSRTWTRSRRKTARQRLTRWCGRSRRRCCGRTSCIALRPRGVTTYVEVGSGRVLSGLVRKIRKDAQVFAFGAPEELGPILASAKSKVQSEK